LPAKGGGILAYKNKESQRAYALAYRLAHPEEIKASNQVYRDAHRTEIKANQRVYRQVHREKAKATSRAWREAHPADMKTSNRAYRQTLMAEALRVLGTKCACPGCEVCEPLFLTIDHINGRSKSPRKHALLEARAKGWDKTLFQILCWNCNMTKSNRGFCPVHQTDPRQTNGHNPDANAQLALPKA
jgi:5-methylcytosine-specific restriction endonuclease McrA